MVKPTAYRQAVGFLRGEFEFSERRACAVLGFQRSSCRYVARRTMVQGLLDDIRVHAAARPRFGYRRIHVLLRRGGWRVNHKRVYRIYRAEGLSIASATASPVARQLVSGRSEKPGRTDHGTRAPVEQRPTSGFKTEKNYRSDFSPAALQDIPDKPVRTTEGPRAPPGREPDGSKELVAIEDRYRESTERWAKLLRDLKSRGMKAPVIAIGDGALGFWAAVGQVKLRSRVTKGAGSRAAGLTMTFKLRRAAEATWRRIDGQALIPLVRAGVRFIDGKRPERDNEEIKIEESKKAGKSAA